MGTALLGGNNKGRTICGGWNEIRMAPQPIRHLVEVGSADTRLPAVRFGAATVVSCPHSGNVPPPTVMYTSGPRRYHGLETV